MNTFGSYTELESSSAHKQAPDLCVFNSNTPPPRKPLTAEQNEEMDDFKKWVTDGYLRIAVQKEAEQMLTRFRDSCVADLSDRVKEILIKKFAEIQKLNPPQDSK